MITKQLKNILILLALAGLIVNLVVYFYVLQPQQQKNEALHGQLASLETETKRLERLPEGRRTPISAAEALLVKAPAKQDLSTILLSLSAAELKTGVTIERMDTSRADRTAENELTKQSIHLELNGSYDQIVQFVQEIYQLEQLVSIQNMTLQYLSTTEDMRSHMSANLVMETFHATPFAEYLAKYVNEPDDGVVQDGQK